MLWGAVIALETQVLLSGVSLLRQNGCLEDERELVSNELRSLLVRWEDNDPDIAKAFRRGIGALPGSHL